MESEDEDVESEDEDVESEGEGEGEGEGEDGEDVLSRYFLLYRAAMIGDWETAEMFLQNDPNAVRARITVDEDTALHVAATGRSIDFMAKLMEKMLPDDLALENSDRFTALHLTAGVGNIEAAKLLVNRNPDLPNKWNNEGCKLLPLHIAARIGRKDMILYLLTVTDPLEDESGSQLVNYLITSGLYGVALHLLQLYRGWAVAEDEASKEKVSPLYTIAQKASAFPSGIHLNFLQRLIYSCVPVKSETFPDFKRVEKPTDSSQVQGGDVENPIDSSQVQGGDAENPTSSRVQGGDVENPIDSSQLQGGDVENPTNSQVQGGDAENPTDSSQVQGNHFISVCQKLNEGLWNIIDHLVPPQIKHIQDKKLMHQQTHQLVKLCLEQIMKLDKEVDWMEVLGSTFLSAVELGIHEIVEGILASYPAAVAFDRKGLNALNLAINYRREKVFNLICQMGVFNVMIKMGRFNWSLFTYENYKNKNADNILHSAGKLAPQHRRNLVSGAALQMQRELQWFKEVEKFVLPQHKEDKNKKRMTPRMLFTEEHKDLVKEGEQWMKDRANSCIIVATLIATVVFAAAITVPGDYGNDGVPNFYKDKWFIIFAVSDAISLFSSLSSVMMFLSILTSRYAEDDFLYALPMRLIIGLVTLFVSVISLVVAFSVTIYHVFGQRKPRILIPLCAMASLPIILFFFLQFPFLVDMVKSTCGSDFFGGKMNGSSYRSNEAVRPPAPRVRGGMEMLQPENTRASEQVMASRTERVEEMRSEQEIPTEASTSSAAN